MIAALAAGSALLAVLLMFRPRIATSGSKRSRGRAPIVLSVGLASAGAIGYLDGRDVVLALIAVGVGLGVFWLVLRHRMGKRIEVGRDRVQSFCEALAAELAAGIPPVQALARAAQDCPEFSAAATAAELGADVPDSLRALASQPGAGDLRLVAASWQVAHRSGAGLASALMSVAETIGARRRVTRLAAAELAGAHATARLMAALPVVMLLLGSSLGVDPLAFLIGHPIGLGALAIGSALTLLGLGWLYRIQSQVSP